MKAIKEPRGVRYVYVPSKINLEHLKTEHPVWEGFSHEKAHLILHWIANGYRVEGYGKTIGDDWTALHSTVIQKNGIRDFPLYRNWLIKTGVIDCDNFYYPNEKSRWYRISLDFLSPVTVKEITSWTLRKHLNARREANLSARECFPLLWNDLQGLELDFAGARRASINKFKKVKKSNYRKAYRGFNYAIKAIHDFEGGRWQFFQDDRAKRLYSNLTSMPKVVRRHLSYRGQRLVEIDIKNSQPFLMTLLLQQAFWEDDYQRGHFRIWEFGDVLEGRTLDSIVIEVRNLYEHYTNMLAKPPTARTLTEFEEFVEICSNGRLYEHMIAEYKRFTGQSKTRDEMKTAVLKAMYSDNRFTQGEKAELKRVFMSLFPHVYRIMTIFKRREKSTLAILLQTVERRLVINRIVHRVKQERPELPLFTIHDAILTTCVNEEWLTDVILEEAHIAIGSVPTLGIEYYNDP